MVEKTLPAPAPGWKTALEVVVAPVAAFTSIRQAPKWFWAFLIASVLGVIGTLVAEPTVDHFLASPTYAAELARNPQFAAIPSDKRDAQIATIVGFTRTTFKFTFIFVPIGLLIGSLVQSVVLLIAGAITKATSGSFARYWSISMHSAVIAGIGLLLNGLIVAVRGPDSYSSLSETSASVPGLALLIPITAAKLHAFFGVFTITGIWSAVIVGVGSVVAAGMKRVPAVIVPVLLLVIAGAFATFGAQ